jgi:hypothetical protein
MKRRTLRGQVQEGQVKRLVVDDGRLNHGYRVVSFHVAPRNPSDSAGDVYGTLSLDYDSPALWEFGDNRQIGWAAAQVDQRPLAPFSLIDPDHVVIMDLYIQGLVGSTTTTDLINYLIVLEPVELTDDEAIMTLIKERSQDDLR